ncbi:hypothetical protein KC887_01345 [Candidatus Kaiserbacteria bacterium]|nr:hypothetical protein [Candidatus Kaiserbacteria bacterium]
MSKKTRQLDAMLYKQQMRFRQTRHNWRQFEAVMSDLGLDAKQIQIAELAALQCGLVAKDKRPTRVLGIGKNDTNLDGDISIPMPGGNGRFLLPKSPFRLVQRMAKRLERGHMRQIGMKRIGQLWFKR